MARPKIQIDIAKVEQLAGIGLTQREIAAYLGIDERTLYREKKVLSVLSDAITRGKSKAGAVVANKLFTKCQEGDVNAIKWYEMTRRGLSEKKQIDWSRVPKDTLFEIIAEADSETEGDSGT